MAYTHMCSVNLVMSDPLQPCGLCTPPGPFVHGIFQARLLEWSGLPFPPQRDLPNPGIKLSSLASSVLATGFFINEPPGMTTRKVLEFYNSDTFCFMRAHNKAMVFPVVMYRCESQTIKKAEHRRIDAFELWCWRRLLRVPWPARRSN